MKAAHTKTISTDKFTFSLQGLQSSESFFNLELQITERLANKRMLRKKIRPKSRLVHSFGVLFLLLANHSAIHGSRSEMIQCFRDLGMTTLVEHRCAQPR